MQFVVISYDIPDHKRRLKVAKLLLDFGAQRVQRSVFELVVTPQHLEGLRARLDKLHKPEEDSIRFYFLCASCRPKVVYLGLAQPIDEPGLLII
ncbi:MAG: CRISPR-associated endonuclease Cas2 [Chloroflexi bacterium]|nr:MAG: CRISPR-associated endonuclease Cas2 [Chloroflexota bacterium]